MDVTPFRIEKFSFDLYTGKVQTGSVKDRLPGIPGYFVVSTAPPNIEDAVAGDPAVAAQGVSAIATDLYRIHKKDDTPPELVITIHGYNTHEDGIRAWYGDIYRYINETDVAIAQRRNIVFIGYRWSSESLSVTPLNLWRNFHALPPLPQGLLVLGLLLTFGLLMAAAYPLMPWLSVGLATLLGLTTTLTATGITLLLLRVSVYFRDVYRATNFGVLDLVELIRQLDSDLVRRRALDYPPVIADAEAYQSAIADWSRTAKKIRLSFIGHSMGALVVTNIVRILSDVFDMRSVEKQPPADIGHTLSLDRLVLVAPDIPVLSIISSRANVLASSLRRFNEAYLFSNEGDLALRLASTTANYISFPSATQSRGYRLGNVALLRRRGYGIVNLRSLYRYFPRHLRLSRALKLDPDDILRNLFVVRGWGMGDKGSLSKLFERRHHEPIPDVSIADLFTFFDCTDYVDDRLYFEGDRPRQQRLRPTGILSRAKRRRALNLLDYLWLIVDSILGRRDVHGGYFHGAFSRKLIYQLAFLGFDGVLKHIDNVAAPDAGLEALHERCQSLGIQVYLSPLRYRADVQGQPVQVAKAEMLQKIRDKENSAV
ncbi:MAG: alpha/beta hydrolase [Cyanobacteria bacterium J06627_15]